MTTYSISAPDGKTYEIDGPAGASQEQVQNEVIRQNPHLSAAPSEIPAGRSVGGFLSNIPPSAVRLGKGLLTAAVNVVDTKGNNTIGNIINIGAGALQNALPKDFVDFVNSGDSPEKAASVKRAVDAANAVGGHFKDRYGSWEKIKTTLYNDPVGAAADLSILFTGGGAAATRLATASRGPIVAGAMSGVPGMEAAASASGALSTAGKALSTAGQYTNPLNAVMPTARVAGNMALQVPYVKPAVDVAKATAKAGYTAGRNLVESVLPGGAEAIKNRAVMSAFSSDPIKGTPDIAKMDQAIAMLEQGMPIEQVAVALKSSGLAALAKSSQFANTAVADIYKARTNALQESQVNQLAGATESVNALQQSNMPPSLGSPNLPRRAVNTAMSQEQNTLAAQQTARADELAKAEATLAEKEAAATSGLTAKNTAAQQAHGVADPNQPALGAIISGEAKTERVAAKAENKRLYDDAFKLAGNAEVNAEPLVAKAEEILGKSLSQFDPKTAHPIISRLLKLKNEAPATPETGGGGFLAPLVSKAPQAAPPAMATLEDLDAIRSAINAAVRDAKISPNVDPKLRNLAQLQDVITKMVKDSATLTPEAKTAYAAAVNQYKTNYVPKFKTGVQENLFRRTGLNEDRIKPEDVTSSFFKGESEAKQFVNMLGDNPAAVQALKDGIEGLYFSKVGSKGVLDVAAHDAFMFAHRKVLDVLDNAGMGIGDKLDALGAAAKTKTGELAALPSKVAETFAPETAAVAKAKAAETVKIAAENIALDEATKGLSFRTTGELRKSVIASDAVMNQALRRMDQPAKAALARGVMQDALNTTDPLKHLVNNERTIMTALRAANPTTAAKIFAEAKEGARVKTLIEDTQKAFPKNMLDSAKRIDDLTKGLPEVRAVVQKIQREIEQGAEFEKLATTGGAAGGGAGGLATTAAGPPVMALSHKAALANAVMRRMKGLTDEKLAAQIGVELANSPSAAAMIARARPSAVPAGVKKPSRFSGKVAPGALMINQLAPERP